MKVKKRSPEAQREAKRQRRWEVDDLRRAAYRGCFEAREALRQIDGAWPPGLFEALNGPYDDPEALDTLLRFLEDDPYFASTGYVKAIALRRLGRWPLAPDDRRRIAEIVLNAVDGPVGWEFYRHSRAARHADRTKLVPGLLERMESSDPDLIWRAAAAALGMFGLRRISLYRDAEIPNVAEAMRERLRSLPEAR